eukprot:TRINITY_DN13409_c0_g1_i1.p2 TRINITY_DN13409_c0_g1~~TRINITY_DN13409_c0_g1_i1.p2  ORF type:complete len:108 (-),score=42.04 TRINITY_DN13409_c0_g1_i1:91-414(-)
MVSKQEVVKKYMEYRRNKRNDEVISLVSENFILISSRDGVHQGKEKFAQYLAKVPPTGTFDQDPTPCADGTFICRGKVRFLMMDWNVRAIFSLNDNNEIEKVDIARV